MDRDRRERQPHRACEGWLLFHWWLASLLRLLRGSGPGTGEIGARCNVWGCEGSWGWDELSIAAPA